MSVQMSDLLQLVVSEGASDLRSSSNRSRSPRRAGREGACPHWRAAAAPGVARASVSRTATLELTRRKLPARQAVAVGGIVETREQEPGRVLRRLAGEVVPEQLARGGCRHDSPTRQAAQQID